MKFFILGILFLTNVLYAAQFDEQTRTQLIDKFSKVYDQLADEDAAKVNVTLRLADLLAEQGRFLANKELGEGCEVCNAGVEQRQKALKFYQEALAQLPSDKKASVLIQMGHLKEMLGQEEAAVKDYTEAVKVAVNPAFLNEAQFSLAEIYFKRRQFENAAKYYSMVVTHPDKKGKRGFAAYRKAWSLFNLGEYDKATSELIAILKNPELLNRGSSNGIVSVDADFQDEVSRDYVIFTTKKGYQTKDFDTLFDLSREESRLDHIFNLADELERLGQSQPAIDVWSKLIKKLSDPVKKWEAHVRYANLLREIKDYDGSLKLYEKSLGLSQRQASCVSDQCNEIRAREKSYVIDWHKELKNTPSKELAAAYEIYNKYNQSMDTQYWGAEAWLSVGEKQKAFDTFKKAVDKYSESVVSKETPEKQKTLNEMYENSLLKRIEIAEEMKLSSLPVTYKEYVEKSKNKAQLNQVNYQVAHLNYENKKYLEAYKDFLAYVKNTKGSDKEVVKLKDQAADLALDSLVLAKRDDLLIETANELTKLLPHKSKEYDQIVRKAVINESLNLAQDKKSDGGKKALKLLKDADFSNATLDEKKLIAKNKMILAEQVGQIAEANGYVDQYLLLPDLTNDEKQFAYKKKAWLSELMFDFKGALAATEKIEGIKEPGRTLQLALLTDLSGGNPVPLFDQYVLKNPLDAESLDMAMELMKKSSNPWQDFDKYQKTLVTSEDKWKTALLLSYEKNPSLDLLSKYISWDTLDTKKRIEILQTQQFKPVFESAKVKLAGMTVDTSNQNKMTASLKARINEIKNYEGFVTKVIKSDLWFGQIYALDFLSKESKRFYDEVMSLPIPEELNEEEQSQYMNLLSQNAAPFLTKYNQINEKLSEIWNQKKSVAQVFATLDTQPKWVQSLWIKEYQQLSDIAPDDFKGYVKSEIDGLNKEVVVANAKSKEIPLDQFMKVKSKVMESPFDKTVLGELLSIEKQRKQDQMVIYLEQRLSKLDNLKQETVK
jgi:hypothetical protein